MSFFYCMTAFAHLRNIYQHFSLNLDFFQPDEFWKHIANTTVEWIKPFNNVMNCDMAEAKFEWFSDGTLNASGIFTKLFTYMTSFIQFKYNFQDIISMLYCIVQPQTVEFFLFKYHPIFFSNLSMIYFKSHICNISVHEEQSLHVSLDCFSCLITWAQKSHFFSSA